MTATEKYQAFKVEYESAKKKLTDQASLAFKEIAEEIFEKYPNLNSFGWTQYTPYFNDGDTCVFGVHAYADSIYINDEREYERDELLYCSCGNAKLKETDVFCPKCGKAKPELPADPLTPEDRNAAAEEIAGFLSNFDDSLMQDIFDDHMHITVYRDGRVKAEEYEHD